MRTPVLPLVSIILLALAPLPAFATWPAGGLQVASPYRFNREGRLFHDGAGNILTAVHNIGHGNWWIVNRVTPEGEHAAGWTTNGVGFYYSDGSPVAEFAVAIDGSGGLWHSDNIQGPTSTDVVLDHVNASATLEPAGPPWNMAATSAQELLPGVARDGGTGAYVAWWRNYSQLYLQRVTSNGGVESGWPATGKLLWNDDLIARPAMLADGSGGVLVLANGSQGLYLLRVAADGSTPPGWSPVPLDAGGATTAELVRADASHVFAVWTVGGAVFSQLVPLASSDPGWPGYAVELFSADQGASQLDLAPDGAGGLHALCRTADDGARWQHVAASGDLAPGFAAGGISPLDPDAVLELTAAGSIARVCGATGTGGGLIACWRDLRASGPGVRARWLRADGTADPTEPAAPRLVAADAAPYTTFATAALEDGDGGAYVLWSAEAALPYNSTAYLTRAVRSGVLDVGRPPGSALAISLGPNPARDVLTVRATLPGEGTARLSLHDLAGRLVTGRELRGAGPHAEQIDGLGALAPGVYLLTIAQGTEMRTARVAVIR